MTKSHVELFCTNTNQHAFLKGSIEGETQEINEFLRQ